MEEDGWIIKQHEHKWKQKYYASIKASKKFQLAYKNEARTAQLILRNQPGVAHPCYRGCIGLILEKRNVFRKKMKIKETFSGHTESSDPRMFLRDCHTFEIIVADLMIIHQFCICSLCPLHADLLLPVHLSTSSYLLNSSAILVCVFTCVCLFLCSIGT